MPPSFVQGSARAFAERVEVEDPGPTAMKLEQAALLLVTQHLVNRRPLRSGE